jgi:hypothetical protein
VSSNTHDIESFRSPGRGPGGQYFQSKTDIIPENAHSGGRERLPHKTADKGRKRMAIITSYFAGETYGLLGPQMAATVIQENAHHECIVVAVAREDDKVVLKKALRDYFAVERPIVGFSLLSGREDLFALARELKVEGAFTILAGPQADMDYLGEVDWKNHDHRFRGLSRDFSLALHGPAEPAIELLEDLDASRDRKVPGLLYLGENDAVIQIPEKAWDRRFLRKVSWNNIYRVDREGLVPLVPRLISFVPKNGNMF